MEIVSNKSNENPKTEQKQKRMKSANSCTAFTNDLNGNLNEAWDEGKT